MKLFLVKPKTEGNKVYIPNHAICKFLIKYSQDNWSELEQSMIGGVFFPGSLYTSHFQEKGIHTYLFSIDIPEIQLITSVFRCYYWTEDLMEWLTWFADHRHHYHSCYLQQRTDVTRALPVNVIRDTTESVFILLLLSKVVLDQEVTLDMNDSN